MAASFIETRSSNNSAISATRADIVTLSTLRFLQPFCSWAYKRVLILLFVACAIGGLFPQVGSKFHKISIGNIQIGTLPELSISGPSLLLAILLINAGFGLELSKIRGLLTKTPLLLATLISNELVPLALATLLWSLGYSQSIVVALTIVSSVPIAGSSVAWSQHAGGSVPISVLLVFLSTVLSPMVSPVVFWVGGQITTGIYQQALIKTAHQGAISFFVSAIILPTVIGFTIRRILPNSFILSTRAVLRFFGILSLFLLNYVNASVVVPQIFDDPNLLEVLYLVAIAAILCALSFLMGWWLPTIFLKETDSETRLSTAFGLGMNNNGAGLVLAAIMMKEQHAVLLFILLYNLVQQIFAGFFHSRLCRKTTKLNFSSGSLKSLELQVVEN